MRNTDFFLNIFNRSRKNLLFFLINTVVLLQIFTYLNKYGFKLRLLDSCCKMLELVIQVLCLYIFTLNMLFFTI